MRWLEVMAGALALAAAVAASAVCIKLVKAKRDNSELNPDLVPRSDGENILIAGDVLKEVISNM